MAYNDIDAYNTEYDASINASCEYEMEQDLSYMMSLDHFLYGSDDD